jgi:pyrimidine-nucleoside phosphorylase/thymidine phosphorylase
VGIVVHRKVGDRVERGEPLCTIHHGARGEPPERVAARIAAAYAIGAEAPPSRAMLLERMGEP